MQFFAKSDYFRLNINNFTMDLTYFVDYNR